MHLYGAKIRLALLSHYFSRLSIKIINEKLRKKLILNKMLSAATDKAKIIILGASVISINIQRKISKYINILEET